MCQGQHDTRQARCPRGLSRSYKRSRTVCDVLLSSVRACFRKVHLISLAFDRYVCFGSVVLIAVSSAHPSLPRSISTVTFTAVESTTQLALCILHRQERLWRLPLGHCHDRHFCPWGVHVQRSRGQPEGRGWEQEDWGIRDGGADDGV